jgi:hypothetical protein
MDCAEKARFIDSQRSKVKADTLGNNQFFFMIKGKQLRPTTVSILPTATYTELTKDDPESP